MLGFMSSFASTILQPIGAAIAKGNYYAGVTFSAIIGGTVSVIGGGKFANGAVTSAFQFMYNENLHENAKKGLEFSRKKLFLINGKRMNRKEYNNWYKNNAAFRQMVERGRIMHEEGKRYTKPLMIAGGTGIVMVVGGELVAPVYWYIAANPEIVIFATEAGIPFLDNAFMGGTAPNTCIEFSGFLIHDYNSEAVK